MKTKKILQGAEARSVFLSGVKKAKEIICSTLGPGGRNVFLDREYSHPHITKDGATVAKDIILPDKGENIGAKSVNETSKQMSEKVGDGSTTVTALDYKFSEGVDRLLAAGYNVHQIRKACVWGLKKALTVLDKISTKIDIETADGLEKIKQVATLAANGDQEVGEKLAEAFKIVKSEGVIVIEESKTEKTILETTEGLSFDKGVYSPFFLKENEKKIELVDPFIFVYEKKFPNFQALLGLFEEIAKTSRPLLIIADEFTTDSINFFITHKIRGVLDCVCTQLWGYGTRKEDNARDIATVTGQNFNPSGFQPLMDPTMKLTDINLSMLGRAKKVILTKDSTKIINGHGDKTNIHNLKNELTEARDRSTSNYDKEELNKRLARVNGLAVKISVGGGHTEQIIKERVERFDDAFQASRKTLLDGFTPGGYLDLCYVSHLFRNHTPKNEIEKIGAKLFSDALEYPFKMMMMNAGCNESSALLEKMQQGFKGNLDKEDYICPLKGYDAVEIKLVDVLESGIINATAVSLEALKIAVDFAIAYAGLEFLIYTDMEEESKNNFGI